MPTRDELDRAARRRASIPGLIAESVRDRGYPPTVTELATALGVSHKQARNDLGLLVEAGVIQRDAGPRGLRVVAGTITR